MRAGQGGREGGAITTRGSRWLRSNVLGLVAIYIALGGSAMALQANSVGTKELKRGAVKTKQVGPSAIRGGKIARDAVRPRHVINGGITTPKLADGAVTEAKLGDGVAISGPQGPAGQQGPPGPKGDQGEQGPPGPSTGPAGGDLTGSYPDPRIASLAVTLPKLAADSVNSAKIVDGSVALADLASNSVNSAKVVDGSLTAADLNLSTLPFWRTGGNAATNPTTQFLGTSDNQPLNFRVNDQRALRLEPGALGGAANVIGGSPDNTISGLVHSATIAGGGRRLAGDPTSANRVTTQGGTIGGGRGNVVSRPDGTVGGGVRNTANSDFGTVGGGLGNTVNRSDGTVGGGNGNRAELRATVGGGGNNEASGEDSTIGGGSSNKASSFRATVGGGRENVASLSYATVSGGVQNVASGFYAAVPGGAANEAAGSWSLAAGRRAKANHEGAFVWGDSQDANIASTGNRQFIVRAQEGIWLGTNSSPSIPAGRFLNTSTGAHLTTGGAWTDNSDRNLKTEFEDVDHRTVLAKVAELPLSSWEYEAEPGARHLGPTAQDFHRAFGLGASDRHIASLDSSGVALAAIKALNDENRDLRERVEALERRGAGAAGGS